MFALSAGLCAVEPCDWQEYGCGLPNISTRCADRSFDVIADVLVWCAKESATENWAQLFRSTAVQAPNVDIDILQVSFGWDVGFRVGVDYGMAHDRWDTSLVYTWFRTEGKDHASTSGGEIVSAFFGNIFVGNPDALGLTGATYHNASIKWKINFNIFDWELGRSYWVSSGLALRPFMGLKGGWIDQRIDSTWLNPLASARVLNPSALGVATENLKNDFWGLGPCVGLNTKWKLGDFNRHVFSLFGDFSGAIMWGHWTFGDVYKNELPLEVSVVNAELNGGASMLRTFTGFAWDVNFFSLRLGYEMQFWLDQLQFYSSPMGRLSHELTLQGGSIDFRLDF